ncbi:MAG: cytochrome ubiquinol oxidase subunit I [Anaerolineaceae bacterium]|jgi:cytochrome d ubiquinol oxidase subunit I|nr:cytochrome ubiquinol oxidase subunit I [Anaerolineaceae bacterium]
MSGTNLSQLQFAITTIYHFFFVPLTLGLAVIVAIMETLYVVKKEPVYKRMTKFWGTLFLINFAVGVVTGIVLEFQFGMNWSEYSRFVGDVFGAPLAMEGLTAFFLESVFLGLWIFGWERLSKGLHLAAIWLVAIGVNVSAFWILAANSFMQNPVGFERLGDKLVLTDFVSLITNPYLMNQFPHTVLSGFTTAGFFVLAISAAHLLKGKNDDIFHRSFKIGAVFALISVLGVVGIGDRQTKGLVTLQPMKLAAAEALWETTESAPLSLFAIIDEKNETNTFAIRIPYMLSFLATNDPNAKIRGLLELQADYEKEFGMADFIPNIQVTFWTFRIMVGLGFLMILMAMIATFLAFRKKPLEKKKILWIFVPLVGAPYLANTAGWLLTEMGRQPWVVYGQMFTLNAGTPMLNVRPGMVITTLVGFFLVYGILMAIDVFLLVKYSKKVPDESSILEGASQDQKAVTEVTK